MNAHHVWKRNFLKLAKWRAVFMPPTCYQGTLSTATGLITHMISKVCQELAKVAKATFGRLARDQSDPRVKLSTPLLTFSHQTVFCISSPALVAPFSSWRVYLFRTLALRALCPPRSLLYHSLSHLISLLLRFSPSLLQAKEILMQHRLMSKEGSITQKTNFAISTTTSQAFYPTCTSC